MKCLALMEPANGTLPKSQVQGGNPSGSPANNRWLYLSLDHGGFSEPGWGMAAARRIALSQPGSCGVMGALNPRHGAAAPCWAPLGYGKTSVLNFKMIVLRARALDLLYDLTKSCYASLFLRLWPWRIRPSNG